VFVCVFVIKGSQRVAFATVSVCRHALSAIRLSQQVCLVDSNNIFKRASSFQKLVEEMGGNGNQGSGLMCTRAIASVVDMAGKGVLDTNDGESAIDGKAKVGGVAIVKLISKEMFVIIIKQFAKDMSSERLVKIKGSF
jgi:hypothetical protein